MSSRKNRLWWLAGVLVASSLSACGSSKPGDGEAATHNASSETKESKAMPVKDSAFGDMVGTMDRARGVETTEMEHKEELDRAIDQNAGGAPAE